MNLCASNERVLGLHVVQRAAPPAREPAPIGVDIVARAIIEARVEQSPAATARFTSIALFFRSTTALFIRFRPCFFVSHNIYLSVLVWLFACHIIPVTAGRQLCRVPAGEASPLSLRNHVVECRRSGGGEFRNCSWSRMIFSKAGCSSAVMSLGNLAADRFHFASQSPESNS
jgi:hypothetical protein